jgi:hypothetical protein
MWDETKTYLINNGARISLCFLGAVMTYTLVMMGDYFVYITSRYLFQTGDWSTHVFMFWRFAFFTTVFSWLYCAYR